MCAIAGLLTFNSPQDCINSLTAMTNAQRHRGPDGGGIELVNKQSPTIGFGHRRLAIIDLSDAGYQPMYDRDGDCWLTFNGEIYNYQVLRQRLLTEGYSFQSETDSEVILKAYIAWGDKFIGQLQGMFAFSIWDARQSRLILARDPLGIKPLYYWGDGAEFAFASEVRALLASRLMRRQLCYTTLRAYLLYGSVQEPNTLIKDIRSIPPGYVLIWEESQVRMQQFWQLPDCNAIRAVSENELHELLRGELIGAIRRQLVADVPLGAFLSGGIDSTAIVALMRQVTDRVKTFSIIFDEKEYDEREYSRNAAKYIGTEHSELVITGDIVRQNLPLALGAFDQPSMDGINTYFVSKITREAGVTVALSGVGGDELFGGYSGYYKPLLFERIANYLGFLPSFVRHGLAGSIMPFAHKEGVRRGVEMLKSVRHPYFLTRQVFSTEQVKQLLIPNVERGLSGWEDRFDALEKETANYDPVNRASSLEIQTYMLSTLLRDTDQMSMAHALEVRVPLIDQQLVQTLFSLPGKYKLDAIYPKPLLTRPLEDLVPHETIFRPKQGFSFPFASWLRMEMEQETKDQFVGRTDTETFPFRAAALAELWKQFEVGNVQWSRVWSVYVLINWLRMHQISV